MIIALGLDDMYDEVMVNKHHNVDYMEGDRVVAQLLEASLLELREDKLSNQELLETHEQSQDGPSIAPIFSSPGHFQLKKNLRHYED